MVGDRPVSLVKRLVYMDHDAGVDDLLSLLLLLAMSRKGGGGGGGGGICGSLHSGLNGSESREGVEDARIGGRGGDSIAIAAAAEGSHTGQKSVDQRWHAEVDIEVLGIGVTPADCFLETGLPATLKILTLLGRGDVPVAAGVLQGPHPFPDEWRRHSTLVNNLRVLNEAADAVAARCGCKVCEGRQKLWQSGAILRNGVALMPGGSSEGCKEIDHLPVGPSEECLKLPGVAPQAAHELLVESVLGAAGQVTLLFTGPLTNLAAAMDMAPEVEGRIDRLYVMGGAIHVPGNVDPPYGDGTAEWNLHWDAPAAARVLQSSIQITLVPLDATNHVPVSKPFRDRLAEQRNFPLSDLAWQCWDCTGDDYHLWDTLTTLAVGFPSLLKTYDVNIEVVVGGGSDGRTREGTSGQGAGAARAVQVALSVVAEEVYGTLLELLKQ